MSSINLSQNSLKANSSSGLDSSWLEGQENDYLDNLAQSQEEMFQQMGNNPALAQQMISVCPSFAAPEQTERQNEDFIQRMGALMRLLEELKKNNPFKAYTDSFNKMGLINKALESGAQSNGTNAAPDSSSQVAVAKKDKQPDEYQKLVQFLIQTLTYMLFLLKNQGTLQTLDTQNMDALVKAADNLRKLNDSNLTLTALPVIDMNSQNISKGEKSRTAALEAFIQKLIELLEKLVKSHDGKNSSSAQ